MVLVSMQINNANKKNKILKQVDLWSETERKTRNVYEKETKIKTGTMTSFSYHMQISYTYNLPHIHKTRCVENSLMLSFDF